MELNTINYRISERGVKKPVPILNEGHYFRRGGIKLQLKGLPDLLSSSPSTNWSCNSGSLTITDKRIIYLADYRIHGIETILFPLGTLSLKVGDALKASTVKGIVKMNNIPISVSFHFSQRKDGRSFMSYASMLQGSMMANSRLANVTALEPSSQQPPCYYEVLQLERLPPYAA